MTVEPVVSPDQPPRTPPPEIEELLARIDALEALLVVYRTHVRPTEKLFKQLERTKRSEDRIRAGLAS